VTQLATSRTTTLVDRPPAQAGAFVLYWMVAYRRVTANFALERAAVWARDLGKPLLVFEPLNVDYRWASDRLHRFVLDGMADNAALFNGSSAAYLPYVEPSPGAGRGLLHALATHAAVVVTDDYPAFVTPRIVQSAARQIACRFEAVDSNGLLPIRAADRAFASAHAFRRFVQRTLPAHIAERPSADPLRDLPRAPDGLVPSEIAKRWPAADPASLADADRLRTLPIDHSVPPTRLRGGTSAAEGALARFLADGLPSYGEARNDVESDATSGLSPYLHFGHLSSHTVIEAVLKREGWLGDFGRRAVGAREGWWGVSPAAEAFLDQIVTWRELGFNMCAARHDYDRYDSLPAWARATLAAHTDDPRDHVYSLEEFASARTHDRLWNAAQGQLLAEGRIHNYLRMLWGKKILEWSASPQDALAVLIELNNRYALDGRDPNSYSGIFWTLGRYDRPWAPERPVFGTIRYMSSANTARKMNVKKYIGRYAPESAEARLL
jgi:deoxyribodipyrimidine photo-lyase